MSGGPKGRPSKKELIKMIYRKLKRVNYELYVKFSNLSKRCIPYVILEVYISIHIPMRWYLLYQMNWVKKKEESNYEVIFILIYYFKIDMSFGSS